MLRQHGLKSTDLVRGDDVQLLEVIDAIIYEAIDLSRLAIDHEVIFAVGAQAEADRVLGAHAGPDTLERLRNLGPLRAVAAQRALIGEHGHELPSEVGETIAVGDLVLYPGSGCFRLLDGVLASRLGVKDGHRGPRVHHCSDLLPLGRVDANVWHLPVCTGVWESRGGSHCRSQICSRGHWIEAVE